MNVVPRMMYPGTDSAITSSPPRPFCADKTAPPEKWSFIGATASDVCVAFVQTIPRSHPGISAGLVAARGYDVNNPADIPGRSEEHTSELQSRFEIVCRL